MPKRTALSWLKNGQTTGVGLFAVLLGIAQAYEEKLPQIRETIDTLLPFAIAALGLVSRDASKTSQQSGLES